MDDILGSPQTLINTGLAWRLEGHVGRTCMALIECGIAILGPEPLYDYWGNRVPSRHEVKAGTMGSVGYANKVLGTHFRPREFDSGRVYRYAKAGGLI